MIINQLKILWLSIVINKLNLLIDNYRKILGTMDSGAHHLEPPSPIQTLGDNLCAYLSIFRNCGAFRLARTICYTVQYNTIRHSTTQLNTKQYNAVHYTICFLWNLRWPGVKTVLKIEGYVQRLTQGYMGDGGSWWWAPDGLHFWWSTLITMWPASIYSSTWVH